MLASCASVQSVSLTQIPKDRSEVVKAESSKFIFLGFNFNNDFIDQISDQLKDQCVDGVISGILTKDESYSYILAHTRKVTATGYCNKTVARATKGESKR
jgi:hypothetical protein